MKREILFVLLCVWLMLSATRSYSQSFTDTIFDRSANEAFAFGADISWGGTNLKDKNGTPKDLLTILEDQGLNSVRYRVWYPDNGPSGKYEVVRNAKAAHDKGFRIMIDFHYSDSWADPGKQFKPAAWEGHSLDQLIQDVYDHTYDVLKALKDVGVTPEWVQIGNETKRGMLWPEGNTNDTPNGMNNFARMINSGYDAIKAVDSTIQAIVHLPDADENSLYRWMFDGLKKNGAKWDIIGMSAYPRWAHLDWETEIEKSVYNMKDMIQRYDTKVMVVETGHYWYEPYISNNFMVELMDTMMTFGALGCFWWEPQSTFGYELTAWDPETRQPTIAMDAYLGIKHINPESIMNIQLKQPVGGQAFDPNEDIFLAASASHVGGAIEKVSFYVDDNIVAEVYEKPYEYVMPNPGIGNYTVYATVTDTKGVVLKSESVFIQVAIAAIFQENENGFCGITNNAGSIDMNHNNFSGEGFINTDNKSDVTVNWTVNFLEKGDYLIEFRYAGLSYRPGKLTINGNDLGNLAFRSTGAWDNWDFASKEYEVTTPGEIPISVTSITVDGLPNIDYLAIKPISNTTKPDASGICLDQPEATVSIKEATIPIQLIVYTNDEQSLIKVVCSDVIDVLSIYTTDGSRVKTIQNVNQKQIEIPNNDLNTGIYLIHTTVGPNSYVNKFQIQ